MAASLVDVEMILDGIQESVTADMNSKLIREFTEQEITVTLKQMEPLKAPGPDGMPPRILPKLLACYWRRCDNDSSL